MNEEPAPAPPTPAPMPSPQPNYIGDTNIIDRSNVPPGPRPPAPMPEIPLPGRQQALENGYKAASSAFNEAMVLVLGVASSFSYLITLYLVKNLWAVAIVSALLALLAIAVALFEYRKASHTSPMTVIGLSAATITLVYVGNIVAAQLIVRSYTGFGF